MKLLLNISNHTSNKWSDKQKEGWDKIVDIPFPQIDPNATIKDIHNLVADYLKEIIDNVLIESDNIIDGIDDFNHPIETSIMLQGEFSFCYLLFQLLMNNSPTDFGFDIVIPTTERKTIETVNSDGTVSKTSIFEFVQWRKI